MKDEVMGSGNGHLRPGRDRSIARAERGVVDEVRLAGFRARGALALSTYIGEAVVEADEERRAQARRAGPELNAVLIDIELDGIDQARKVQRGLFRNFGL